MIHPRPLKFGYLRTRRTRRLQRARERRERSRRLALAPGMIDTRIVLEPIAYAALLDLVEHPPEPTAALRALFAGPA